ncbi:hypothetical protein EFK50_12590 [Nocardioides marmoriginsengisoli]|uniref:DUF4386 domain-containing protein n=1 Tax=Nocardioides marmoriginsengisoli TaxID=661483 RepID=A0A3N0CGK9_9ACTN|nr:hypothetical protein [Nocardioides marmoriginsengisoli]RNL62594.1 hypothetical protein EFK50_12590 [Nocardioides marmoriginsengisoli]
MSTDNQSRRIAQGGPPLAPVAIAAVALFMASLVVPTIIAGGDVYPSPFGSGQAALDYFADHRSSVQLMALLQFAAAIPFAVFAATVSVRLNRLGVRAPGATIALAGGVLAAGSMLLSAMLTWAVGRPETLEHAELVRLLHDLAFISGGPGVVVPGGLLVAGIAVPGLLAGLLPRWFALAGLVLAGIAMISILAVRFSDLAFLLPIARFPGFLWLIASAVLLPQHRAAANRTAGEVA